MSYPSGSRLSRREDHELLDAGLDEADRDRAHGPRERRCGGPAERRSCLRDGDAPGIANHSAHRRRSRRFRVVRSRARTWRSLAATRHHRERAQPEQVLAPAVRARRIERRLAGVSRAPCADVRRAEGRVPGRAHLRRRCLAPWRRPSGGFTAHALTHRVHSGSRNRVPRERARPTGDGRLRDPPLSGQLEPAAVGCPSAHDDDRRRRLREARRPAGRGVRRDRTARLGAAHPLRRVRRRVRDPRRRRQRSTRGRSRRRRSPSSRRPRPPTTSRRSHSPSASRTSRACCSSSRGTSGHAPPGSRGSSTSTALRRRACRAFGRRSIERLAARSRAVPAFSSSCDRRTSASVRSRRRSGACSGSA